MDDVFKCAILSSARKRRELPDAKLQTDALLRRHALPRLAEAGETPPRRCRASSRRCSPARWSSPSRSRAAAARMPASTRECRCAPSGRIRTSPARSFWRCSGNICRRISALALEKAPERFHARLSAVRKTYIYRVWNSDAPCVFERKYVHAEPRPLDLDAMRPRRGTVLRAARILCLFHRKENGPRRHAHDRVYRDRTLRGRSAAYVYRRRVLIQYGAHSDRHAARGRSRRAPSGRYGGDPCLAQPCECRFTAPAQGLFLWDVTY